MYNHIGLIGNPTRELELKKTSSGISFVKFTLAVDRDFPGKNGEKEADFIDCTAWRQQAEYLCKYGGKGKPVCVSGRLGTSVYTDNEGNKRRSTEVRIEECYLVGYPKREEPKNAESNTVQHNEHQQPEDERMNQENDYNIPTPAPIAQGTPVPEHGDNSAPVYTNAGGFNIPNFGAMGGFGNNNQSTQQQNGYSDMNTPVIEDPF